MQVAVLLEEVQVSLGFVSKVVSRSTLNKSIGCRTWPPYRIEAQSVK